MKFSIASLAHQWMLCSEWVPSEWESKQLIKTSQKSSCKLHMTPAHHLTSCEVKSWMFVINTSLRCFNFTLMFLSAAIALWKEPWKMHYPFKIMWDLLTPFYSNWALYFTFSFCIQIWKKCVWNNVRVSKLWQNIHFWFSYLLYYLYHNIILHKMLWTYLNILTCLLTCLFGWN